MSVKRRFARYVSFNIFGMLAVSLYIIADTYFISKSGGANGVTILNLALPMYNFIYAFGSMLGLGAATRFTILRAAEEDEAEYYFGNALKMGIAIGLVFTFFGIFSPETIIRLMGGRGEIVHEAVGYFRWMLLFGPAFTLHFIFSAFVRNDKDPSLAMIATVASSLFNIVFDYIFVFPLGMGIAGAALATALAPLVSISINCIHFTKKKNTIKCVFRKSNNISSAKLTIKSCQLGITGFMNEISLGITNTVFNYIILSITGNIGVAAYGIVANFALVVAALFDGLSQGAQPLVSESYGKGDRDSQNKLRRYGLTVAISIATLVYAIAYLFTDELIKIFNSEGNSELRDLAHVGLRIYFIGFIIAGVNIFCASFYAATERPKMASLVAIMRGIVAILLSSVTLSYLLGMTGVWMAFPVAELMTFVVMIAVALRINNKHN